MDAYSVAPAHRPLVVILSSEEMPTAWGRYDAINNVVCYVLEIADKAFMPVLGTIEYHEMWHVKQAVDFRAAGKAITEENYNQYMRALCKKCKKQMDRWGLTEYNVEEIRDYAKKNYRKERFDEVEAEYITKKYTRRRKER